MREIHRQITTKKRNKIVTNSLLGDVKYSFFDINELIYKRE